MPARHSLARTSIWACVLGLATAVAVRDVVAEDNGSPQNSEKLIQSIQYVGKACPDVAVPVLGELFRHVPRNTVIVFDGPDMYPVRRAVVEAIGAIPTPVARRWLRETMNEYLEQGAFGDPHHPTLDSEYMMVVGVDENWDILIAHATPDMKEWFLKVSQNKKLIPEIRCNAYAGYLKLVMDDDKRTTTESRVTWLLDGFTPYSGSDWDTYVQPPYSGLPFTTYADWAIHDSGRALSVIREGRGALPLLEKRRKKLEAQKPLDGVKQNQLYWLGGMINLIYIKENLANPPNYPTRPANADEEWARRLKADKQDVLQWQKKRKAAGLPPVEEFPDPDPSKILKPPKPLPPNADDPLVEELIAAIQKVGETKRPEVLPVLRELYRTTPKDGAKPGEIHPVRKAIAEAVEAIGGKEIKLPK